MTRLITLCLLLASMPLAAQFEDVTIETTQVADGIYMLEGRGGNLAVSVGEDGVALVDDQYAPLTEKILAAIAELSDQPVSFVINTHWHGDHVGGNENLGKQGAVIMSHDNVRERMSVEQHMPRFDRTVPPSPPGALPVITYDHKSTLHFNGEAIRLYHTPNGHTDGDSIVHFTQSNVIHMGDNMFHGMYPFIDISSGGSVQGMIAAAQLALGFCDSNTRVIPGHGELTNCAGLESYGQMLADSADRVQALMDQGMTLEQIQQARPNAEQDERLGGGWIDPDSFIEFLYQSLDGADG